MKKITIIILTIFFFTWNFLVSQCIETCENLIMLDNWDDDSLFPVNSPNAHYSDVWGYVDDLGNEYGIIGGRDSIFIIDVTDPNNITRRVGLYQGDTSLWRDFKVYDDFLYSISDQGNSVNKGVSIYDLSSLPENAVKIRDMNSEFPNCHNIFIDVPNDRLYAAGFSGSQNSAPPVDVCVYDLSIDPSNPSLIDCINLDDIETGGPDYFYFHDLFVKDNIVYGSHGDTGYYIWDMNDISNISLLGSLDNSFFDFGYVHSSWNSSDNSRAIVATEVGSDPKLYWVDQSDPSLMQVKDVFKDPLCLDPFNLNKKRPHNPFIIDDKIYFSGYEDGLNILNIDFIEDTIGRVAFFDTYPDNTNYANGFRGNWGAFPFLPSGTLLASDRKYGLFTLKFQPGQDVYTFIGTSSSDWFTASNWMNNKIPPEKYCGNIVITSDCNTGGGIEFCTGTTVTVTSGATFQN